MKPKHTLPVHVRYKDGGTVIVNSKDLWVAEAFNDDFANHIVKCVNSHDELVEALKELTGYPFYGISEENYSKSLNKAKQALKKAER